MFLIIEFNVIKFYIKFIYFQNVMKIIKILQENCLSKWKILLEWSTISRSVIEFR